MVEELKRIRSEIEGESDTFNIDVEYQIQSIQTEQIDYNYIVMLLQSLTPSEGNEIKSKKFDEVEEHINKYKHNKEGIADIMLQILNELKDEKLRLKYKDINMASVINDEIEKRKSEAISKYADTF